MRHWFVLWHFKRVLSIPVYEQQGMGGGGMGSSSFSPLNMPPTSGAPGSVSIFGGGGSGQSSSGSTGSGSSSGSSSGCSSTAGSSGGGNGTNPWSFADSSNDSCDSFLNDILGSGPGSGGNTKKGFDFGGPNNFENTSGNSYGLGAAATGSRNNRYDR